MSSAQLVAVVVGVIALVLLGTVIFPLINRWQFRRMPYDQQIRILMKQAKKLVYFKNISNGSSGTLIYIKNKRKILTYPWKLIDGKMLCTKKNPYTVWDYPEEHPAMTDDEIKQAVEELEKYNEKSLVKLYLQE
ncbi:MAG: hypothetical protein IJ235_02785 [Eubacterium sp.]|nr:hypothetical protein [Eubacterium sp.]MBQ8981490.1 hypothetical protein [Eubacterium sp.]MBR1531906.1 hypothetical protein [Eubacterium sp.]MBR2278852.1 hypothetical protein [Eubacterium sp.]